MSDDDTDIAIDVETDATADESIPPALLAAASALRDALLSHSLPGVHEALSSGAPAWYQDPDSGWGALHHAAEWGDEEAVKAVLENGGVWNAVDNLGNTAGDIAISRNDSNTYTLIRDHGLRSELLLQLLSSPTTLRVSDTSAAASPEAFLASRLTYRIDERGQQVCMVTAYDDEEGEEVEVGVMMGWERRIMEETSKHLAAAHQPSSSSSLRILNVGFGLGIIDTLFRTLHPHTHTIIEPHPDVLAHMRSTGWAEQSGVDIRAGRWQDVLLPRTNEEKWDIVYFDTFSEGYEQLKAFFELLPSILSGPSARFSFFNGLGATNALFYDVSSQLAEAHLSQAGLLTEWHDVYVEEDLTEAWDASREYFRMEWYKLPVCRLK